MNSRASGQQAFDYYQETHLGLGHTLSHFVRHLLNETHDDENTSHILIASADQVALTADDYVALIK